MNQQAMIDPNNPATDAYGIVTAPDTFRIERLLPGPIERVWSYLTESGKRAQWLAAGDMDLRVGGDIEHVFRNSELTANDDPPPAKYAKHSGESRMHGRITACEPPRLLAYSWGEHSEVTFELTECGSEVQLTLTHRRLATRDDMLGVSAGWHTHLDILADRLSGRTPPGFWRTLTQLDAEYDRRIPAASR